MHSPNRDPQLLHRHDQELCELRNDVHQLKEQVLKLTGTVQRALDCRMIPTSTNDSTSQLLQRHDEEVCELRNEIHVLKEALYKMNLAGQECRENKKVCFPFDSDEKVGVCSRIPDKSLTTCCVTDHIYNTMHLKGSDCDDKDLMTSGRSKSPCYTTKNILEAAEVGDKETVQELLDSGTCVHKRNIFGDTALHLAAAGGYDEVVKILLKAGASVDAAGIRLHTPLHRAATGGHFIAPSVQMDSDAETLCNRTLHRALTCGHVQVVRLLLNAGADVRLKDADGNTPLRLAVQHGAADIVFHLICHEKNKVEKDRLNTGKNQNRILTFEDVYPNENLLECVINLNTVLAFEDVYPGILRSITARNALRNAAHDGKLNTIRALLDSITFDADDLNIALRFGVEHDHAECVELLLKRGADKNYKVNGKTLLDIAVSRKYDNCVQTLIRAGAKRCNR